MHLWADGPAPWEYIEYLLQRHVYHCTPTALHQVPPEDILVTLTILRAEAQHRAAERKLHNPR